MIEIPGKDFKMSATEITQKQYEEVMGENPSWFQITNEGLINEEKKQLKNTSNNPVETVNWYDAIYFCNKLSKEKGRTPEYAVDGNTDVTTWNYTPHKEKSSSGDRTHPVAQKKANGYGLYDMSGNVWEWCWDVSPYYIRDHRYCCGGSYRYDYYNGDYEVSYRDNYDACLQRDYIGFRIVCSASN